MNRHVDPDPILEDTIAGAVLGDVADDDAHDFLVLVARSADAERVTKQLLQQSVDSARAAGCSWAAIGRVLEMSRQAAQQRFGALAATAFEADERWLGPVTAFDELAELALAGRLGWHTVEAGFLRHRMVRTDTQWEHRRVLWSGPAARNARDGWQIGCRAFPWLYLIRDTGRPVEVETD